MQRPNSYSVLCHPVSCKTFSITLFNARSLRLHFLDVTEDPITDTLHFLMFTESHIYLNRAHDFQLPEFDALITPPQKDKILHGLACYYRKDFCCTATVPTLNHIECLEVQLEQTFPDLQQCLSQVSMKICTLL